MFSTLPVAANLKKMFAQLELPDDKRVIPEFQDEALAYLKELSMEAENLKRRAR